MSKTFPTEGEDESESGELYTEPRRPINIASKMGMDAFKLFLIDTPGEKLFLLWIEIEKLKTCESVEKRKRFGYSSSRSSSYVPVILLFPASYHIPDYITIFFYLVATLLYYLTLISSLYM